MPNNKNDNELDSLYNIHEEEYAAKDAWIDSMYQADKERQSSGYGGSPFSAGSTIQSLSNRGDKSGKEFRRTLEGMPPDMSDEAWDEYTLTGREPEESTLNYMLANVDPSNKESVKSLQYTLKRHGYNPGDIDGDMGKGTVAAMRKAQGERDAPGILDRLTDFLKKIY